MARWQLNGAHVPYCAFRVAGVLAPRLPTRLGYGLFSRLWLVAARFGPAWPAVWDNVTHVLGASASEVRRRAVANSIYRHQGKNYFDVLRLPVLSNAQVASLVTVRGLENLDAALTLGRGAIIVSIHLGNVEIPTHAVAMRGYPILGVMEHLQPEALYRYMMALRGRRGVQLVPADGLLRPVFRALKANGIVGLVADRDTTRSGVEVEFFGARARLPDGYAQLAARTGAALVPCFGVRNPDDTMVAHLEPPIIPERAKAPGDYLVYMDRVLRVVERYIARYPEQWVMFEPIWQAAGGRTRPA